MDLGKVLLTNYLPYAKSTIIARAIPGIDGLKPVQRRLLYTMQKMGLLGNDKVKSQKIDGQTMSLHPHGDSSIYEAMVLMTTGYDGMNVPFVESKGSFGKKFSRDLKYAAPRYTEAKLAPIARELFEGINENAVDMVDNYDGSDKEPAMLPSKFPNILVNSSTGVAVGTSSNIPCFSLKNVCNATIGILNGQITNASQLAEVLGVPEFTTGGFLHASKEDLEKLCETGKGSFVITGKAEIYNDRIVITEIPYTTTIEDIMEEIDTNIKEKKLLGVRDVKDETGLEGLRLIIEVKSGYNSRDVAADLCRLTSIRTSISFRTRVIVNNRCKELNLMEVLNTWIEFRKSCIHRVHECRLDKYKTDEHFESTWEKIKDNIPQVVAMIANNDENTAKANLISMYGLDEVQADYLLDMKIKSITKNRAMSALAKLKEIRDNIVYCNNVISDDSVKGKIIIDELNEIIKKYGRENRTTQTDPIVEEVEKKQTKISDELVVVVLTKAGYLRRLTTLKDMSSKFVAKNGDEEIRRWSIKNNEHILVFDRFGTVHKILVDSIDASNRAVLTDKLLDMAKVEKIENVVWIDACGDYSGYFNLVYPNGRGTRVCYDRAQGNREQYKGLFEEVKPNSFWITQEDKFFMVTHRNKAAYCDISMLGIVSKRVAFKVARVSSGDYFTRLINESSVPCINNIDISKYNKDYTVSIGDDRLWVDKEEHEEVKRKLQNRYNELTNADKAE